MNFNKIYLIFIFLFFILNLFILVSSFDLQDFGEYEEDNGSDDENLEINNSLVEDPSPDIEEQVPDHSPEPTIQKTISSPVSGEHTSNFYTAFILFIFAIVISILLFYLILKKPKTQ